VRARLIAPATTVALAAALLAAAAIWSGSASALTGAGLAAILLLSAAADPPVWRGPARRRAVFRLVTAVLAIVTAVALLTAALAGGTALPDPDGVALVAGALALGLAGGHALLRERRGTLDPRELADRTLLLRTAAIGGAVLAGSALARNVFGPLDLVVGVALGLLIALEGVAVGRPGGAGVRRVATADEVAVVVAAIAYGPTDAVGHRRLIVRRSGGVERLEVEILLRSGLSAERRAEVSALLEASIATSLEGMAVSVRPGTA
jgi:hypothetical protein